MRILIDGFFFQIARSGIAQVWGNLLRAWQQQAPDIEFLMLKRGQDDIDIPGVQMLDFPPVPLEAPSPSAALNAAREDRLRLQRACTELRADAFMSTYFTYATGVPNVLLLHDCIPEAHPALFNLQEPIWQMKSQAIYNAAAYIAVSASTARDLLRHYDVAGRPLTVMHNGLGHAWRQAPAPGEGEAVKNRLGITGPYVLLPGLEAYASYKNQAAALLALRGPALRGELTIVCTGGRAQAVLGTFSHLLPLSSVVCANLPSAELVALTTGALAVIYPSLYEGFGLPLVEALSCGVPIITCRNSSLGEVGGTWATYVQSPEALQILETVQNLLDVDAGKRLLFAEGAQRYARSGFQWSTAAARCDAFVRQQVLEHRHREWAQKHVQQA